VKAEYLNTWEKDIIRLHEGTGCVMPVRWVKDGIYRNGCRNTINEDN